MKTNELEKEIGLSKYTIRYYEKEGLIQPKREENGYRDYDDETVQKLKIIKFLRNLQISVDDIKAILDGELDFRHCLKINQVIWGPMRAPTLFCPCQTSPFWKCTMSTTRMES